MASFGRHRIPIYRGAVVLFVTEPKNGQRKNLLNRQEKYMEAGMIIPGLNISTIKRPSVLFARNTVSFGRSLKTTS
jgi:hypothetical protein